jgi:type II secretory pathway component PulF
VAYHYSLSTNNVWTVRIDELMILYAAVNKTKNKTMIRQWLMNFKMMGPLKCTSLLSRIVSRLGILEGNLVPFIDGGPTLINQVYL